MVSLLTLWLPVLVSAIAVFVASSIIHMFLRYHANDYKRLPDEEGVMDALLPFGIPPGDYAMPHAGSMDELKSDAYQAKTERGPVVFMTVLRSGQMSMGRSLGTWFAYILIVIAFAAYVAGRALPPGAEYLEIFRYAGTVTFIGFALALWQNAIWYGQSWKTVLKNTFDGAVYALITAGIFGTFWPS